MNEMLNATKEISLQKFMIVSFVPHALKHKKKKKKSDGVPPLWINLSFVEILL